MQTIYNISKHLKNDCVATPFQPILVNLFTEASFREFYKKFNEAIAAELPVIPIYIDSFGGHVHSLFGMLDLIDASPVPVATICVGKAMSCGATLLASGTPGYRYASPLSEILIHEVSGGSVGKISDMEQDIKAAQEMNRLIHEMLDKKSGNKKGFFQEKLKANKNADLRMTAKQAKTWGIIDKIGAPSLRGKVEISYGLE